MNNRRSARRNSADLPPAPSDELTPANEKSEFKKPTFWVSVLTLIVIAVYTGLAYYQVQGTQTANSIAKKALTEANKPYVMATALEPHYTIDNGIRHFRMGVVWTKLGNTPANLVRVFNCDPIVRDDLAEPDFHCNLSENIERTPIGIIGPKYPVVGPVIQESDFEATGRGKKAIYVLGT